MVSLGFTLDPIGTVREIIDNWNPEDYATEKEFEDSLLEEFQKKLKNQVIYSQYGSGLQRVDIVIDKKVPIELKKDLTSTAVLQRTIGQLDQYLKDWRTVFLVLCGDVSHDLLKHLEKYVKDSRSGLLLSTSEKGVYLIVKPTTISTNKIKKEKTDKEIIDQGETIKSFYFDGSKHVVSTWKDLLIGVIEDILSKHKKEFDNILNVKGKQGRIYFSKKPKELDAPLEIDNTKIYVETKLGSKNIIKLCYDIIREFGYSEDDLKIENKDTK